MQYILSILPIKLNTTKNAIYCIFPLIMYIFPKATPENDTINPIPTLNIIILLSLNDPNLANTEAINTKPAQILTVIETTIITNIKESIIIIY